MNINRSWGMLIAVGVGIAILVTFFSPFASGSPDGLERVAEDEGFIDEGQDAPYEVIADYAFPGIENEAVATVLAGIIGVLIVAGIGLGIGMLMGRTAKSRRTEATSANARQARD